MKGQKVLVTGAGAGIGRGLTKSLLEMGAEGGILNQKHLWADLKNILIVFQVWAVSRTKANLESLKVNVQCACTMANAWQLCFLIVQGVFFLSHWYPPKK